MLQVLLSRYVLSGLLDSTILLTPTLLPPEAEGEEEDQTSCVLELFEQRAVGEVGRGHNVMDVCNHLGKDRKLGKRRRSTCRRGRREVGGIGRQEMREAQEGSQRQEIRKVGE